MKKLVVVLAMGVLLSGCELSYIKYSRLVERCQSLGGTPLVYKTNEGMPYKVRCEVNGMVFMQGTY